MDDAPSPARILRVGLTGNIAAGKSTVARRLAELGCHVIDADAIAHTCLAPNQPAHVDVVAAFGDGILTEEGVIDRPTLGRIVFADATAKARLEAILHPWIRHREEEDVARFSASVRKGIAVTEAALLYETESTSRYHRMVVIVAPDHVRLERLLSAGMNEDDARRRMAAQMEQAEKAARADYVIDNGGDPATTRARVENLAACLHRDLAALATGRLLPAPGNRPPPLADDQG